MRTAAKTLSDDDSSSSEVETPITVSVTKGRDEEGAPIPTTIDVHQQAIDLDSQNPPSQTIMLQAIRCKHEYPVAKHSRAYRAFTHQGYDAPLCPHCAIAAPPSPGSLPPISDGGDEEQEREETARDATAVTTVTATRCGHPIAVRRRTASIIAANPLTFSRPSSFLTANAAKENGAANGNKGTTATEPPESWPGFTRASTPAALSRPPLKRKCVRANLNVERCVGCVRREYARSRNELARAREEVMKVWEEVELVMEADGTAVAGHGGGIGSGRDLEWEGLAGARLAMWRRRCVGLRCGLEVLAAEEEGARREAEGEAPSVDGEGEGKGVVVGRGLGKRMGSVGSLRSLRGLSGPMSWWKGREKGEGAGSPATVVALKPALKMSLMPDGGGRDAEGAKKKKKTTVVRFDPETTNFDRCSRRLSRLARTSKHYRPGRWATDGLLEDTSGFSLKTESQIRDWYFPLQESHLAPREDEISRENTRKGDKRITGKAQRWWWPW
ncbi:hypothetical protein SLS55_004073 [Diplodia seriata]|uniref:Uncharacterized protein n=1 Tax=Diplodia seriata TaxID=420778 RepID=A0ABR3CIC5_9PEZI